MKYKLRPFTIFDWLHSLSQEELAKKIAEGVCDSIRAVGVKCSSEYESKYTQLLINWMKQPYKED